jgi:hypothetical protein
MNWGDIEHEWFQEYPEEPYFDCEATAKLMNKTFFKGHVINPDDLYKLYTEARKTNLKYQPIGVTGDFMLHIQTQAPDVKRQGIVELYVMAAYDDNYPDEENPNDYHGVYGIGYRTDMPRYPLDLMHFRIIDRPLLRQMVEEEVARSRKLINRGGLTEI